MTLIILIIFFIIRLVSLAISVKHAKKLVQQGAKEYGQKTQNGLPSHMS